MIFVSYDNVLITTVLVFNRIYIYVDLYMNTYITQLTQHKS